MQPLLEAASLITQEIERTKQHLVNLEQALAGLRPLITIDAATMSLPYTNQNLEQTIEDVSVVLENPAKVKPSVKRGAKSKPASVVAADEIPATNAKFWLSLMGRKKMSLQDMVYTAITKLEIEEWARPKIKMRAQAWLYSAISKDLVTASVGKDGAKMYQRVTA
jgi:hypothetical protein